MTRYATPSGWNCPPGTGSRSPRTPRSRKAAGRRTAGSGWTCPTSRARRIMRRLPRVYQTPPSLQMLDIIEQPIEIARRDLALLRRCGSGRRITGPASTDCMPSARRRVVCTERTGSAATPSSSPRLRPDRGRGQRSTRSAGSRSNAPRRPSPKPERKSMHCWRRRPGERTRAAAGLRDTMTSRAGVVRDEAGLLAGLTNSVRLEDRMTRMGVHPDIAGFQDLAHAFDLKASALAARATPRRLSNAGTRGCRNRSDYPELDESLQVNLVWSGPGSVEREQIPPIPDEPRPHAARLLRRQTGRVRSSFRRSSGSRRAGG